MKIADRIRNNEITSLRLSATDEEAMEETKGIVEALRAATHHHHSRITSVVLGDDLMGCVRHDARVDLLRALSGLPHLRECRIEQGLLPVASLAGLLCGAPGLRVLRLEGILLQGVEEDFREASVALQSHGSLKELVLEGCRPSLEDIDLGEHLRLHRGGGGGDSNTGIRAPSFRRTTARMA